jgi:hypothetical protein
VDPVSPHPKKKPVMQLGGKYFVLYDILIEFGVPMKLVRRIKKRPPEHT